MCIRDRFNTHRGLRENQQETGLISQLATLLPGQVSVEPFYILQLFSAAVNQGIQSKLIDQSNLSIVSTMPVSADAQARITTAVNAGHVVVAPTAPVTLNGAQQFAWLDIDPATGQTQDTTTDGGHQSIAEFGAISAGLAVIAAVFNPGGPLAQFFLGLSLIHI